MLHAAPPSTWSRRIQWCALATYALLFFTAVGKIGGAVARNDTVVSSLATWVGCFLAALVLAWLLADLFSGLIHYIADNHGSETTPLFGRILIAPFREHHASPLTILEHDWLETNANNALIALPLLAWIPLVDLSAEVILFFAATSALFALWALFTNQIHAWAHMPNPPPAVEILQRSGLILAPHLHQRHHDSVQSPRTTHYCITSGIWDRSWALIIFWRRGKLKNNRIRALRT